MANINENYLKLKAGYLFPEIGRRLRKFKAENPEANIISMGIGDVTMPLAPAVVKAMAKAVTEMGQADTFRGYDDGGTGYEFLRKAIALNDYAQRGVPIEIDEIFVSDGAKCDVGNMQEIFAVDNVVAVTDPVYPVYVDTNVMAGRTGDAIEGGRYGGVVYLPCNVENQFVPEIPTEKIDLIYLCYPNNPTGAVATKAQLKKWVDYAKQNKAIILFDAAYEAFIQNDEIPHSIYEIEGAKEVAIEFRSYSKTAGFTGVRCAFSIVPKELMAYTKNGEPVEVNKIWARRHCTKFNGVSYVTQAAAAAVYSDEGKEQIKETINVYMDNAAVMKKSLTAMGYVVHGGENAPYLWMQTPENVGSWEFFDKLLKGVYVVGTPGAGFGAAGEGFFRLTAFASKENTEIAMQRIAKL